MTTPYHKSCVRLMLSETQDVADSSTVMSLKRRGEQGYTLVAVLAAMAILALLLTAAAPNLRQQAMREREQEAIFRGEEIADAIRLYIQSHNGQLPTSIDQLIEGVPQGTKKKQILRHSAAIDPLSSSGEWRLVKANDPAMLQFQLGVMRYAGGRLPQTTDPQVQRYAAQLATVTSLIDTGKSESAPGGEDESDSSSGPFIGVTSRSRRNAIITYYGIDRHDHWVFTPLFR